MIDFVRGQSGEKAVEMGHVASLLCLFVDRTGLAQINTSVSFRTPTRVFDLRRRAHNLRQLAANFEEILNQVQNDIYVFA